MTSTTSRTRQIARLTPGEACVLKFQTSNGAFTEDVKFVSLSEDGQSAIFRSHDDDNAPAYDWEAYRFQGRWCYGSSAQRLSLVVTS